MGQTGQPSTHPSGGRESLHHASTRPVKDHEYMIAGRVRQEAESQPRSWSEGIPDERTRISAVIAALGGVNVR
jgi:hypothetical protein